MGDFDKKIKSLLNEHQNQIDEKKLKKRGKKKKLGSATQKSEK